MFLATIPGPLHVNYGYSRVLYSFVTNKKHPIILGPTQSAPDAQPSGLFPNNRRTFENGWKTQVLIYTMCAEANAAHYLIQSLSSRKKKPFLSQHQQVQNFASSIWKLTFKAAVEVFEKAEAEGKFHILRRQQQLRQQKPLSLPLRLTWEENDIKISRTCFSSKFSTKEQGR